jgi:hypothetical protein
LPNPFSISKMESVVNYLEDVEKKLSKEMSELFSKMREQRDTMSLQGIEDMYTYKPVEGVLYEPCVRIPLTLGPRTGHYYWNEFTLPKDEYVIFIKELRSQHDRNPPIYNCIVLTNYGRCFTTKEVRQENNFPSNDFANYHGSYLPNKNITIIKLDPLPYKLPTHFFKIFLLAFKIGDNQTVSDTTTFLQELNKEFYLFAGKWQPHMTQHANLDIDLMRKTISENKHSIEELKNKEESLEIQNKRLLVELNELKNQKAVLEKEKAKLLPLEKYKEALLEFMENHYIGNEPWDHDDTLDKDIIEYFSNWHNDKVFMDQYEYNDVMNSKEELNEYRIYKKVKGEMVSSGLDNSSVARNVRSIKKSVKDINNK